MPHIDLHPMQLEAEDLEEIEEIDEFEEGAGKDERRFAKGYGSPPAWMAADEDGVRDRLAHGVTRSQARWGAIATFAFIGAVGLLATWRPKPPTTTEPAPFAVEKAVSLPPVKPIVAA